MIEEPFVDPVGDYVAEAGESLGAVQEASAEPEAEPVPAYSYAHGVGELVTALARAGLRVEQLREHAHSNGCRVHPALVQAEGRRWVWPEGAAPIPLMFDLVAVRD